VRLGGAAGWHALDHDVDGAKRDGIAVAQRRSAVDPDTCFERMIPTELPGARASGFDLPAWAFEP
jgi:hypothetical protein